MLDQIQRGNLLFAVLLALGFVVGITIHEASHAYSAYKLGDDTAYREGRVTLNPAEHLDLFGSLMLIMVGFGWGKPVPVVPSKLRGGIWGPVTVAAAGPISNLLLVVLCAVLFKFSVFQSGYLLTGLRAFVLVNALLFVFNLIPIPPLDGAKILYPFLPRSASGFVAFMNQYGPFVLLGLVLVSVVVPQFSPLSYVFYLVVPLFVLLAQLGLPVPLG